MRIRVGLLGVDGTLASKLEAHTEASRGPEAVLETLTLLIGRVLAASDGSVAAIGIAAAGQIHPETQAVVYVPNLNWNDVPALGDWAGVVGAAALAAELLNSLARQAGI